MGQWESLLEDWPVRATHVVHLRTGKLLMWYGSASARLWDPDVPGTFTPVAPSGSLNLDLFCSGHSAMADGRILIAGGGIDDHKAPLHAAVFDPTASPPTWTRLSDMLFRRWYPTCTTLANGNVAVFSGWVQDQRAIWAEYPDLYKVGVDKWEAVATYRGQELYPYMFVMPDERLFDAGCSGTTAFLNTVPWPWQWGSGISTGLGNLRHDSAAMFDAVAGKILRSGGSLVAGSPSEGIDSAVVFQGMTNPTWAAAANMNFIRLNHNLVCLPDGKVLAVGGTRYTLVVEETVAPVMLAEVYDPAENTWTADTAGNEMAVPRWYHSTAMLLRDGRVLAAGGDNAVDHDGDVVCQNGQIYRPAYLSGNPPRPTIEDAPTEMEYKEKYDVEYNHSGTSPIAKAALTRLGSVTHGFDQDQRYVPLEISLQAGNIVRVTAPSSPGVAPPGYYMLWILDANGVPCEEAAYVRLVL